MIIVRFCIAIILLSVIECNIQSNSENLSFEIFSSVNVHGNTVKLDMKFGNDLKDKRILIDKDAFSIYDPKFESDSIKLEGVALIKVLEDLRYSQFVLENNSFKRRLFSDVRIFDGEQIEMKSEFSLTQSYDTVDLVKGKGVIHFDSIQLKRLKIDESDSIVRLHYLFKPTPDQMKYGFRSVILTSNWFSLKH